MRIEFCLSSLIKKPFEVFWFTQTSFYVHQKTSKGFLIRDAKQSLLRNETQFSQCTTKPSRFTVQNSRKPVKTHCAKSCAFLSLMTTRSVLVFSRKRYIVGLMVRHRGKALIFFPIVALRNTGAPAIKTKSFYGFMT